MGNIDNLKILLATAGNVFEFIEKHPASFDVRVYKAKPAEMEQTATGTDTVGSLEATSRKIEYQDPTVINRALAPRPPGGAGGFMRSFPGLGMDFMEEAGEEPLRLLINDIEIPEQSVIVYEKILAYDSAQADQQNQVFRRFVKKVEPVGNPPAFNVYHTVALNISGVEE